MKLFFIRHGQTDANFQGIYSGQSDVMLTELGRQQAESLRPVLERFSFDRVYSSDLTRAIHTQQLALPCYEGIRTPLLREYDVGSLTGLPYETARQRYGNVSGDYVPYGGEDIQMVQQRVRSFLDLVEQENCEYAAAFSHNGTIKAMLRLVLGEHSNTANMVNKNCSIAVFDFDGKQWRLLAWNYMDTV